MPEEISCFRCGESLEYLSLPLSRRDECRACSAPVHVCRMCLYFDTDVPRQCTEDDAEDVQDKEKVNFCDWFKPTAGAFDSIRAGKVAESKSQLDALFGDDDANDPSGQEAQSAAEDLFK